MEERRKNNTKDNRGGCCVGDKMELDVGNGVEKKEITKIHK